MVEMFVSRDPGCRDCCWNFACTQEVPTFNANASEYVVVALFMGRKKEEEVELSGILGSRYLGPSQNHRTMPNPARGFHFASPIERARLEVLDGTRMRWIARTPRITALSQTRSMASTSRAPSREPDWRCWTEPE